MFTPTGYQAEDLQAIIDDINAIFIEVFGADFNTNPSSPSGQFVQQLANIAIQNQSFMVLLTASLYNPDVAQSVWLDAICALSGIKRIAATYSTVTCTCSGSSGTVIPMGTQISNTNGDIFASNADGTIGGGGTVSIVFTATSNGDIPVLAGTVINIINKVYGWDSVTNPSDGIEGNTVQSDNDLRLVRSALLSSYGSVSLKSIYAAVHAITGIKQIYVEENNTAGTIVIGGVSLIPNCIYVVAVAGADSDIAKAIYIKKAPGVNMYGNTTATYFDPTVNGGYTFTATFERPTAVPLQVNVSIKNSTLLPSDIVTQIQTTLTNNFNGEELAFRAVQIGQIINVSRFVPDLIALGAGDIRNLTIQQVTGGPSPANEIQLNIDKIATLVTSNVIVTLV